MNSSLFSPESAIVVFASFLFYFLGILLRHFALPPRDPLPLGKQLAIGLILSLLIVPPFLALLRTAFFGNETNAASAITTIGVIVEQGFLMNETLARKYAEWKNGPPGGGMGGLRSNHE